MVSLSWCVFCLLVVLFKLTVRTATWLARKTPLMKPICGKGIVSTKPRPKTFCQKNCNNMDLKPPSCAVIEEYRNLLQSAVGFLFFNYWILCKLAFSDEAVGSNLGQGYFAPRSTQPSVPPRSVNESQLRLGRQRQVWLIPPAGEMQGEQVKLWYPLISIPELSTLEMFCVNALYKLTLPLSLPLLICWYLVCVALHWCPAHRPEAACWLMPAIPEHLRDVLCKGTI